LTGVEVEVQTLDEEGYIVNKADLLIKACRKRDKKSTFQPEVSKQIVEFASFPSLRVQNVMIDILRRYELLLEEADVNNLVIYPLGLYPGKFTPLLRKKPKYKLQEKILGDKFALTGKCTGFHYHYTLPRSVFDKKSQFLRPLIKSKLKQSLIDSYNLAIAMDPALLTLMQSSPFYDGKFLAKDSRVVVYRGGRNLKFPGVYSKLSRNGQLPPYKHTLSDLTVVLNARHTTLQAKMEKIGIPKEQINKIWTVLDFSWNPIRINKLGTLEQRTADTNHPKYFIAYSILLKFLFRRVQQDFLRVVPSDIGINEPFKLEGRLLYIPPHTYVRKHLQYHAAYSGLENNDVNFFCKRFMKFARSCVLKEYNKSIKPLVTLLNNRKTVSDILIGRVKKMGLDPSQPLSKEVCAELALKSSSQLLREIESTKMSIINLE
jgi:hypothetical protein